MALTAQLEPLEPDSAGEASIRGAPANWSLLQIVAFGLAMAFTIGSGVASAVAATPKERTLTMDDLSAQLSAIDRKSDALFGALSEHADASNPVAEAIQAQIIQSESAHREVIAELRRLGALGPPPPQPTCCHLLTCARPDRISSLSPGRNPCCPPAKDARK